ncbi:MAG: 5'/3'-nucleotidase SurE [Desulfonatronovibrionaceae bacterium]
MDILLTNDDGIHAPGLRGLHRALLTAGYRVYVVAPLTEQSAVGHSVTIFSPVRVREIREDGFSGIGLSGTPVDCVKWALSHHLQSKPDLIISGINNGANVGVDILYSGTVSAATEGALAGIPALAVSLDEFTPRDMSAEAQWTAGLIPDLDRETLPGRCVLNINFPSGGAAASLGIRVCPQTDAVYNDVYDQRNDPRGRPYYWLSGDIPMHRVHAGTDRHLLTSGYTTLTPLKFDLTNKEALGKIKVMFKDRSA